MLISLSDIKAEKEVIERKVEHLSLINITIESSNMAVASVLKEYL